MEPSRFKRRETQTVRNQKVHTNTPKPVLDVVEVRRAPSGPQPLSQPVSRPAFTPTRTPQFVATRAAARPIPSARSIDPLAGTVTQVPVRYASTPSPAPLAVEAPLAKPEPEPILAPQPSTVAAEPLTERPVTRIPGFDVSLPGGEAESPEHRLARANKWRAVRTWVLRTTIVSVVLVLAAGGVFFAQSYGKLHKVFKGGAKTVAALAPNVDPDLLKGEGDGRINILLLGRGGGTHDGPDLTDTMLLDSIDPVTHHSALISIPRDLWVTIPGSGSMKINAAWETGEFKYLGKIAPGSTDPKAIQAGFDVADQTVENVLGVTIDYNMIVDFQAFQQAVDTVGGVTVNVPTALVDPTMAWQNNNNPILAAAGIDSFNGAQALNYVRSRETTSDFARAERQRSVLEALKAKVETLGTLSNPTKISGLLSEFGNNVSSDLSLSDATRMYSILKDIPDASTSSIGLADPPNNYITTATLDGQSIDEPTAGLGNYTAIQNYIRTQLPDGYILKENAKVLVLNGTSLSGVATTNADTLKSYGYNVIGAASTPHDGYSETMVIDLTKGKDPYTRHYLEERFNTTAVTTLPDTSIQTNGADFVIIIGTDEATSTEN